MYVVHVAWLLPGRLALWAEDSAAPPTPPLRPGRRPRRQPHPFAASPEVLTRLLADAHAAPIVGNTLLALPTRGAGPVESPELVREVLNSGSARAVQVGWWEVPSLEYDADAAIALLANLAVLDVALGAGTRYLIDVAGFAADLVARGRLLPSVELPSVELPSVGVGADGPRAVWRPLLAGPDAAWARALAAAMPASVAAATATAATAATATAATAAGSAATGASADRPVESPAAVLADALDTLTDAAARARLHGRRTDRRGGNPTVRAWLAALTGTQRFFDVTLEAAAGLADDLARWQRDAVAGPVRGCFRLVEPVGDDGESWVVQFALQATDEPSLLVDADSVWRSRGALRALARHVDAPQETLLAELGRASRLYPQLEPALRTSRPAELPLDTAGAHQFLGATAPLLASAGFGVLLPSWWTRPSSRLGLRLSAATPAQPGLVAGTSSGLGFDAIADYHYELALGGETLSEKELAELATLKAPLVRIRGQWVELDARRLAAGLKMVGRTGQMSVGELFRLGAGIGEGVADLPIVEVAADGWLGDLLSGQSEHRMQAVAPPESFHGQLRPYQGRGLAWLDFLHRIGLGGVLADDMGLGKTVQLLALLAADIGTTGRPSLLVCPMSLVGNWQRETARFTPDLRVHVHHGAERARGRHFDDAVAQTDLVITTYALAARDAAALSKIDWQRIVVDEAQAIKNAATKQATAIRSLPARTRIAVTGTPVENRLADLWSLLEFANPGLLGSAPSFKKRYAEPIERHGDEEAAERLRRFTGPFILRRLKTDRSIIADLPDKLEMDVFCTLTNEQASLYRAVVDDMLERIANSEGIERRGLVLATMTKLKQVCNHPAQFLRDGTKLAGRSGKLDRLEEILDEVLGVGEKALLFTQYAEFGGMLRAHLSGRFGREVLFLHGGVSKAGRDAMVARFQSGERGAPPLFVLSLKAGGTGLTLTSANHVVHVDRWWNPAVEDQATDRAFRIGQRRNVQVRKFVCAGTLEEKIAAMIKDKRGLAARIVGTGEGWLTEMSTGQLQELLRLEAQPDLQ